MFEIGDIVIINNDSLIYKIINIYNINNEKYVYLISIDSTAYYYISIDYLELYKPYYRLKKLKKLMLLNKLKN